MLLKELTIDRTPSYGDNPNHLRGFITFGDSNSEHKIVLAPLEINNIIKVIADTVAARAVKTAKTISAASVSAQEENKLLTNDGELSIDGELLI